MLDSLFLNLYWLNLLIDPPFGYGSNFSTDSPDQAISQKSRRIRQDAAGIYSLKFKNPYITKSVKAKDYKSFLGSGTDPNNVTP